MCLSIAINRPGDIPEKSEELGFQWMIIHNGRGYRCGYVRLPLGHPWHGKSYGDDAIDSVNCHGGITFADADVPCDAPGPDTDWWIGFDCAHAYDAPDPELPITGDYFDPLGVVAELLYEDFEDYQVRSQEYVKDQVFSICAQAFREAKNND